MEEERRERLRVLADSINDTARMARTTNSLFLFVALYLALTLLSTNDENLLRDGQVVLPQVGAGISVVQSYMLAPLVFLYLHGQALALMTVLARKMRSFEAVLMDEFPDTMFDAETKRSEFRDWLSAFALVQVFQRDSGLSGISRVLTWLAVEAIPLALLFALDLSFVRYQSDGITWMHHGVVLADLALIVWFNRRVFGRWPESQWGRFATISRVILAGCMLIILAAFAHPPNATEDRYYIWLHDGPLELPRSFLVDLLRGRNLLDVGPCRWWGAACRYLDLSHLGAPIRSTESERRPSPGHSREKVRESNRSLSVNELDVSGRNLRFARFRHAQLDGADFQGAQLQHADFEFAQLQRADFAGAHMQRAWLTEARLPGADFYAARLHGANLNDAHLQEAHLRYAVLEGTELQRAHLQGAILRAATLDGANLERAQMQGAILWDASFNGANLSGVRLEGAQLDGASLRGANLTGARLEAVKFEDADLGGAILRNVSLLCSFGAPYGWRLAWMPGLTYEVSSIRDSEQGDEPDEAVEALLDDLITDEVGAIRVPYEVDKSLKDHLRERLEDCPEWPFSGAVPKQDDLVVYRGWPRHAFANWPEIPEINDAYWNAWGEWTVKFACESEFNARSSMRHWSDIGSRLGRRIPNTAVDIVRQALVDARSNKVPCRGLSRIPDDDREWNRFVDPG